MEREIANVAAACAMRGFRYMAFPPIVFDQPVMRVEVATLGGAVKAAEPLIMAAEPVPIMLDVAAPEAAPAMPRPQRAQPAIERADIPTPISPAAPRPALAAAPPAERRFALLSDVSAEIRRQTTR